MINQSALFMIYPNDICDTFGSSGYYLQQSFDKGNEEFLFNTNVYQTKDIPVVVLKYENMEMMYKTWFKDSKYFDEVSSSRPLINRNSVKLLFAAYDKGNLSSLLFDSELGSRKISDFGKEVLFNRFYIDEKFYLPEQETIEKYFCSIIVEPDVKRGMLKELEMIGIDVAFVYRELEYTALKIKSKYM